MDNFDNDNNVNEKNVIQKERHRSGVIQGLLLSLIHISEPTRH